MYKLLTEHAWVWLGLAAAFAAAGVTLFGKLGLAKADVLTATAVRAAIMAVALLALALLAGRDGRAFAGWDGRAWLCVVLSGLCGALSWLAYFAALKVGDAGKVAALDRLSIAVIFVLGVVVLGERYSWRGWLGLALLVAGVFLVATDRPKSPG